MGLFDKLFKKELVKDNSHSNSEHCVIIKFNYGLDSLDPLHSLEIELDKVLQGSNAGDCDGHEIATDLSDGIIYLYGKNAEIIFKIAKPLLEKRSFVKGATVKLRFGPPEDNVKELELTI